MKHDRTFGLKHSLTRRLILMAVLTSALAVPASTQTPAVSGTATDLADKGQYFVASKEKNDPALQLVGAQDPNLVYEGRIDFKKPEAPALVWQASRIRTEFEGTRLVVVMEASGGQTYMNVEIDGVTRMLEVKGGPKRYVLQDSLQPGWHSLVLFKRTEASAGSCKFRGIEVEAGRGLRRPALAYKSRMLFLGDSITAGACSEDGATDQWSKFMTHNNAVGYASQTARALQADWQNVSVSGMGMVTGWNNAFTAPQIWNRLALNPKGPLADLQAWVPDMVFINLGENDGSYTSAQNQPFPDNFAATYITYVDAIRAAWPKVHMVLLRGGMFNGFQNPDLIAAWEAVVAHYAADPLVHSYAFAHHSGLHPRTADHSALAGELVAWLKDQPGLKAWTAD